MVKLKTLIVKSLGICCTIAVMSFTGCAPTDTITLTEADIVNMTYEQDSSALDNVEMEEYSISLPENGYVGAFCIYGSTVYYTVSFGDYLMSPGQEGAKKFEPQYNTQIRTFANGQDVLLYQYNETFCVEITDMYCNGEFLIWEDYGVESDWSVKCLPLTLEESGEPETIINAQSIPGDFWSITPVLTEDKVYWYHQGDDEAILYQYDLKKKEMEEIRDGLTLSSPYEHVSIVNGVCTTYEEKRGQTKIRMEEIDSQNTAVLLVDGKVQNPICNGDICVWEAEEDILYIHLLEKGVTERIDIRPQHIFSYGLIGNYVIVNCKGDAGAYCYDVKNKIYESLDSSAKVQYLYTFQGQEDNVYMEIVDEDEAFKIKNVKIDKGAAH